MLEINSFTSLKNESLLFWTRVNFKGGVKFSKILRGLLIKGVGEGGGGGLTDLEYFFGGGGEARLGKKG